MLSRVFCIFFVILSIAACFFPSGRRSILFSTTTSFWQAICPITRHSADWVCIPLVTSMTSIIRSMIWAPGGREDEVRGAGVAEGASGDRSPESWVRGHLTGNAGPSRLYNRVLISKRAAGQARRALQEPVCIAARQLEDLFPAALWLWSVSLNRQPGRLAGHSWSLFAQRPGSWRTCSPPPFGCGQCDFVNPPGENQNLCAASSCLFLMLVCRASTSNVSCLPSAALPCLLSDGPAAGPWTPTTLWGLCPGPCPASPSPGSESAVTGTRLTARLGLQPACLPHRPSLLSLPVSPGHSAPLLGLHWCCLAAPLGRVGHGWTLFPLQIGLLLCCQFKDSLTLLSGEEGLGAPARARLTLFPFYC